MSPHASGPRAQALPDRPFFAEAAARAALARERFFDAGQRPTGLVSEPVIQSWQRCLQARRVPPERLGFDPVSASRQHRTLQRARPLLAVASPVMDRLAQVLAATGARAILCDGEGVVVQHTPQAGSGEPVLALAARVGVDLSEHTVGTTAPGIVLHSARACVVSRGEHFFELCGGLSCAAAPIRDRGGRLAGVLDLTIEGQPFGFDAAALVGLYAAAIENALLEVPAGDCLVLRFQADPLLLGTPMQALAGVDGRGRIAWVNAIGRSLLGEADPVGQDAAVCFGRDAETLLGAAKGESALAVRLANGLVVWVGAQLQLQAAALDAPALAVREVPAVTPGVASVPEAGAATLAEHDQRLVQETLLRCGGNVSRAARALGVSRGLLYRRLAQGKKG
jgi:sigma-54 dependent transcriptional regulator, acetoin dehydrogenase operon transcriptional activator AcoR